ncbi:unnamed protein product, partial [Polarella glacialis]
MAFVHHVRDFSRFERIPRRPLRIPLPLPPPKLGLSIPVFDTAADKSRSDGEALESSESSDSWDCATLEDFPMPSFGGGCVGIADSLRFGVGSSGLDLTPSSGESSLQSKGSLHEQVSFERLELGSGNSGSGGGAERLEVFRRKGFDLSSGSAVSNRRLELQRSSRLIEAVAEVEDDSDEDFECTPPRLSAGSVELDLSALVRDIAWLDNSSDSSEPALTLQERGYRLTSCLEGSEDDLHKLSSENPQEAAASGDGVKLFSMEIRALPAASYEPSTFSVGAGIATPRLRQVSVASLPPRVPLLQLPPAIPQAKAEPGASQTPRTKLSRLSPVTFYLEGRPEQLFGRVRSVASDGTYTVDLVSGARMAGLDMVSTCSEAELQKAERSRRQMSTDAGCGFFPAARLPENARPAPLSSRTPRRVNSLPALLSARVADAPS